MTRYIKKISFLLIALSYFAIISCDKSLPYRYVDFQIDLNDPVYIELQHSGGYVMVNGGVRGIIIYRSGDEFKAYDRMCTYEPNDESCRVSMIGNSGVVVQCHCCDSQFELNFGQKLDGPATKPLREYSTTYNGDNILMVYN